MAWWDFLTLEEQLEICNPYIIIFGIILIFSTILPFNFLRRARFALGLLCIMGGILVYIYLTYLYDPDYFGKDGPVEAIVFNSIFYLKGAFI